MANKVAIKPLGSRVLIKRRDAEDKTEGGLYLPDNAQEKNQEAVVVAVGSGGKDRNGNDIEFTVKEGDVVLVTKYAGTEVKLGDEVYNILDESEILGVIEGKSNK